MLKNLLFYFIPIFCFLIIFQTVASFSFASSGELEEEAYPQTTSKTGIASLRSLEVSPVAYTAEDEAMICSDAFITCSEEDASEAAALRVDHPQKAPDAPFSGQATITMYNSFKNQTDDSPCISADGTNICKVNYNVCASNDYKFGTRLRIEGLGECIVRDRMNRRYTNQNRIDFYAGYDLKRAISFGKRKLEIQIIN